jgi:GH24 family phage-related lysozyme (muramidase)
MLPTFEGRANFLYPDGGGLPTIGEGHAVQTPDEAVKIFGDERAREDWQIVRHALTGQRLHLYERLTKCRISNAQIDALKAADIAEVERKLDRHTSDWRGWPAGVQDAVRDIVWNTGHLGFPMMLAAIRRGDWEEAARESHRHGIQRSRNDWTRDSILSAREAYAI